MIRVCNPITTFSASFSYIENLFAMNIIGDKKQVLISIIYYIQRL